MGNDDNNNQSERQLEFTSIFSKGSQCRRGTETYQAGYQQELLNVQIRVLLLTVSIPKYVLVYFRNSTTEKVCSNYNWMDVYLRNHLCWRGISQRHSKPRSPVFDSVHFIFITKCITYTMYVMHFFLKNVTERSVIDTSMNRKKNMQMKQCKIVNSNAQHVKRPIKLMSSKFCPKSVTWKWY